MDIQNLSHGTASSRSNVYTLRTYDDMEFEDGFA